MATKKAPPKTRGADDATELLKIGELSRRSSVPLATVKHYVREGLVRPARAARNIAYYDAANIGRIRRIKELQQTCFLPLKVIREMLDGPRSTLSVAVSAARPDVPHVDSTQSRTRAALVASGVSSADVDWLRGLGIIVPLESGGSERYSGDDVEVVRLLGEARKAGLTADALPLDSLARYVNGIRALVATELRLLDEEILSHARGKADLGRKVAELSEKLIVLSRRRLIRTSVEPKTRKKSSDREGLARRTR